ncbi:MAG: GNAT family N-acetyltransferase [Candidatus Babeliaceae bacterium]
MVLTHQRKYFIATFLIFLTSVGGIYWWHKTTSCTNHIYSYEPDKDRAFILDLFQKDLYWLVSEYVTDFSAEYMLDNRASSRNPADRGNLLMYVYRDSQPRGFVAYFKKKGYLPLYQLLFLVVPEEFRQKGYGKCLLKFALEDLKKKGCLRVELTTRVSNYPAQKTYLRLGFHETSRDEEFVHFEKDLF